MYMCVTFDLAKGLTPDGAYALIYVSQYCCCRFSLLPANRWDWIGCSVFHSEIRLHLWLCLGWLLFKNNNFVPFTSLFSEFDTYRRIWVLIRFYLLYLYNLTLQTMLMYINVVNILRPLTHFPFMVLLALKPPSYSEISKALSFISLLL